eukprot:4121729-Prymnesium_polylepis.1
MTYLSSEEQAVGNSSVAKLLRWNHFGRKNLGYLYAISQGAQFVFDFDDVNVLQASNTAGNVLYQAILTGRLGGAGSSPSAHAIDMHAAGQCAGCQPHLYNPYPDFLPTTLDGRRVFAWPRGFPLDHVNDNRTFSRLGAAAPDELEGVGIFQSLADHAVDVDATYRMTR